jgi:hypothetical protein
MPGAFAEAVVLQRDVRRESGLGLGLYRPSALDRLVNALVERRPIRDAAGVLIDDQHLAVCDDGKSLLP